MKRLLTLTSTALLATTALANSVETVPVVEITSPDNVINLAICLDTSGSMSGLIDAARTKIWAIVNDLALAEPAPDLRVALLTYGNDGHAKEDGWVFIQTDFTEDLDLVSERLFGLGTNGGEEYVGRVVDRAVKQLSWNPSAGGLKLIIVAGNESADQDPAVSFRTACKNAITNDVMVNSIYCGNPADSIAPSWREVALLADGKFASIDQNEGTIVIATPFDEDLARLSASMNATYISYTAAGAMAQTNQVVQDANAMELNDEACSARALTKSTANYRCAWDLVTQCETDAEFDLASIKKEDLPEEMREMTLEEQTVYIQGKAAKRTEVQAEIQEVGRQRTAFITEQMRQQQLDPTSGFGYVILSAIREQARSRGFAFPAHAMETVVEETANPAAAPAEGPIEGPVQTKPGSATQSDIEGC